ncbi:MAG: hypothetical protein QOG54_835 [Actinomycetota bacterium]|jgi:RNA polymerase sigma-70 factor (ECF subfamily)|nr:hypothetical protein [Actinomycetota bacterium]
MEERENRTQAFANFFRAHYEAITRSVYGIVRNAETAKDVAQDAFIQVDKHWAKVSRYDRPDLWVRRVAIRLAVKNVRRQALGDKLIRRLAQSPRSDPSTDLDLDEALSELSPMQRAAVVLYYYEGFDTTDLGHILDCSAATVRVHLNRARNKLRAVLGEASIEL